jgi:hypothetical protein
LTGTAVTESFDEPRFLALLNLAGPEMGHELLLRLDEDLSRVAAALVKATAGPDHPALREQSHVLLAISGTVGADGLYVLAERLNRLVRALEPAPVSGVLAEIAVLLDQLIARVRSAQKDHAAQP